jgi:hypothetical protein
MKRNCKYRKPAIQQGTFSINLASVNHNKCYTFLYGIKTPLSRKTYKNIQRGEDEMKKKIKAVCLLGMACIILIAACAPAPSKSTVLKEQAAAPMPAEIALPPVEAPVSQVEADVANSVSGALNSGAPANGQKIIKNAEIDLLVKDTDIAIDRITQIVGDVRGYIVSSKSWFETINGENMKSATITLGVPVDEFELVLRRLREIAIQVNNETASGQDVSEEYVNLQSNLDSLRATRERIKSFLDKATTVEEALKVNDQLLSIDKQIDEITGRMNYLSAKASFSSITITLHPKVEEKTPTPTYTPTPTSTPTPWNPGTTFNKAGRSLGSAYRGLGTMAIWLFVVVIPVLLPFILVGWGIIWGITKLARRKSKKDQLETKE